MRLVIVLLALLLPAFVVGCDSSSDSGSSSSASLYPGGGSSPASTPEDVAEQFLRALQRDDHDGASRWFTEKARSAWGGGEGFQMNGEPLESWTVGVITTSGQEADVPVTGTMNGESQTLSLKMRKDSGEYRIYGLGVDMGGSQMTVDLEEMGGLMDGLAAGLEEGLREAFNPASFGPSPVDIARERARFDAVAPLEPGAAADAWAVTEDFDHVPALEALRAVAAGLALDPGDYREELSQPVSVRTHGLSHVEALERIAAAAGLYPVYPGNAFEMDTTLPMLRFAEGPRPWPVQFVGPFMVSVESVEERAPSPTGSVVVAVRSLGLPGSMTALMSGMSEQLSIGRLVDAQDRNLNANEGVSYLSSPRIDGALVTETLNLDLRNLLRDVTAIAHLEGTVHLRVPGEVVSGSVSSLHKDSQHTAGDFQVYWKAQGDSLDVRGAEDVLKTMSVMFGPKDAQGNALPAGHAMTMAWGDQLQSSFTAEGAASFDYKLVRTSTLDFAFDLQDVALSKAAEQPVALTELSFDGAAPISVEFVSWDNSNPDFPEAQLRIVSHCNKPVESAQASFHYLDAAGREIKDFPHSLTGEFTFEGHQPLVTPGQTVEQASTAFFRPEGTRGLTVEITAVTFVDGSEWSAAQED